MRLFVIIGNIKHDGLIFEKCFTSRAKAKEYFEVLKDEYKNVGVFKEYDDLIAFNNGDEYKIVDFECKGVKYES